ncbi:MAG: transcription antitermination factor NusB [Candidatus Falkowbacteria bacterium]
MSKQNRHTARRLIIQALFQWDFNQAPKEKIEEFVDYLAKSLYPGMEELSFVKKIINGIFKNITKIDEHITKYAPEWPLSQITIVDRNILRMGIYELLFDPDTPAKVAIDEALEIAREFNGEPSRKFVNGVLGSIFRDIKVQKKSEDKENDNKSEILNSKS